MEDQNSLKLNELAIGALRESAKWCMFLSIVGFIFIGLMVIFGAFMSVAMSAVPDAAMAGPNLGPTNPALSMISAMKGFFGLFYILIAVLYFFPVYYLFNYSKGIKQAFQSGNNDVLTNALVNLKSHHKFLGIMTIVMLSLYVLAFIGIIIFAAKMASSGM